MLFKRRVRGVVFVAFAALMLSLTACGMGGKLKGFEPYEGNARECANLRIFQIMVSCFQDGDHNIGYSKAWGPNDALTCGDLQGIINSLDYIKSLNCNAIWMTPIFDSSSGNSGDEKLDSTGYYAYDFFNIDPKFGTKEKFQELVTKCHEKGIYVILDGVFGHWNAKGVKKSPNGNLPVRSHGQYDGCDYPQSLEFFKEVATYWIKEYKIDGWRLDQCYQAGASGNGTYTGGHNYWKEIRAAVKSACAENAAAGEEWGTLGYMVGEDWQGNASTIQVQVVEGHGLNSCFDFPSRYKIVNSIAREEWNSSTLDFAESVNNIYSDYLLKGYEHSDSYLPNLFITNHDVVRFGDLLTWKHGNNNFVERTKVGLAILAGYTGPITLYYGDEWGATTGISAPGENFKFFSNGAAMDNSSRPTGKITGFSSEEKELVNFTSKLMKVRSEHEALWNGYTTKLVMKGDFFACKKTDKSGDDVVYVLLNYSATEKKFDVGKAGVDLLTNEATESKVTVPAFGTMFIQPDK